MGLPAVVAGIFASFMLAGGDGISASRASAGLGIFSFQAGEHWSRKGDPLVSCHWKQVMHGANC